MSKDEAERIQENKRLWVEESERRDADWDASPDDARPASEVIRKARANMNLNRRPEY